MYTKNRENAFDLVQNCIVKCMVSIKELKEPRYFRTWLTKIMINCFNTEIVKQNRYVLQDEKVWYEDKTELSTEEKMDLYQLEDHDVEYEQAAESAEPIVSKPKEEYAEEKNSGETSTQAQESGLNFELQENRDGMIQIFSSERITTSNGKSVEIGRGSLNLRGVFTDTNTFVGVARSGETLEDYNLPEEVEYTITSEHIKVYAGDDVIDVRGQWEYRGIFKCTTQALDVKDVEMPIADGYILQEIRLQPYEVQAVIAEPVNGSLAIRGLCIEAFDENGNLLNAASNAAARFTQIEDSQLEIWMFERPENAERVTFYVLDDWKGYLYSENPWTGKQMMEFLENNCITCVEVEMK